MAFLRNFYKTIEIHPYLFYDKNRNLSLICLGGGNKMEFIGFIIGLIILAISLVLILISAYKKKSYVFPIILMAIGFIIAVINLFNLDH